MVGKQRRRVREFPVLNWWDYPNKLVFDKEKEAEKRSEVCSLTTKKPQTLPSIDWFTILENMTMTNIDAGIQAQVSVNALKPALNWDDASLGLSFPKLGFGKGIHLWPLAQTACQLTLGFMLWQDFQFERKSDKMLVSTLYDINDINSKIIWRAQRTMGT